VHDARHLGDRAGLHLLAMLALKVFAADDDQPERQHHLERQPPHPAAEHAAPGRGLGAPGARARGRLPGEDLFSESAIRVHAIQPAAGLRRKRGAARSI
jgi:hypothetical protein